MQPVAGAAIYITLVEHPARIECGVEIAAAEFAPSYRRATTMQATCAALALLSSIAAWLSGASFWLLVGGIVLGTVIPFTLIVILRNQQAVAEPDAGQAVIPYRAATRTLGRIAHRAKCAQRICAAAIPVLLIFKQSL